MIDESVSMTKASLLLMPSPGRGGAGGGSLIGALWPSSSSQRERETSCRTARGCNSLLARVVSAFSFSPFFSSKCESEKKEKKKNSRLSPRSSHSLPPPSSPLDNSARAPLAGPLLPRTMQASLRLPSKGLAQVRRVDPLPGAGARQGTIC